MGKNNDLNNNHTDFKEEIAFLKIVLFHNQRVVHYEDLMDQFKCLIAVYFLWKKKKKHVYTDFKLNSQ